MRNAGSVLNARPQGIEMIRCEENRCWMDWKPLNPPTAKHVDYDDTLKGEKLILTILLFWR